MPKRITRCKFRKQAPAPVSAAKNVGFGSFIVYNWAVIRRVEFSGCKVLLFLALGVCASAWACSTDEVDRFSHVSDPCSFSTRFDTHDLWPLSDTHWQVTSFLPNPPEPYKSMTYTFRRDGAIFISITRTDGRHEVINQGYRIVKSRLCISNPDASITNYKFRIDGDNLILEGHPNKIVMKRL